MGKLANTAEGMELQPANPQKDIRNLLQKNWPRIAKVLPAYMSPERMMQLAISTINKNPKLANCTPESVLSCFMTASSLGLEPNDVNGLGQCYIIPYGKTATFIPGYKGLHKLAMNSGEIESLTVEAVYKGDEFSYSLGDDAKIVHVPNLEAPHSPDTLICAYCITKFKDGGIQRKVMTKADIDKRRAASSSGKTGPWASWYEEMCLKTVMRAASKTWPLTSERSNDIRRATVADEMPGGAFEDVFAEPVFVEQQEVEEQDAADTEPKGLRKAVCQKCGNEINAAQDATLDDLNAAGLCCEEADYQFIEED